MHALPVLNYCALAVRGLSLAVLFLCLITSAAMGIELRSPGKVARGEAFLAEAYGVPQGQAVDFFWRGKKYRVKSRASQESNPGEGKAAILLPVPLNEKNELLLLKAALAGETVGSGVAERDIAVFARKRPVQKLNVDPKFVEPPASALPKIKADREKVRQALASKLSESLWTLPMLRPVPGSVSSLFGLKRVFNGQPRGEHRGLDLRGAQGEQVLACADGEVALADNQYFGGNVVYLNHGDGVFSAYLHLSKINVEPGQRVSKGDQLGLVGATGRVTGPHLHLNLLVQGEAVDPEPFLESIKPDAKKKIQ